MLNSENRMPNDAYEQDKILVAECLKGNPVYQKQLFEKFYAKMLAVCMRYTKDRDEAKDVLQDGFIKVFQGLNSFSFSTSLEYWVRRIMINTSIDNYRKESSKPNMVDVDTALDLSQEADAISKLSYQELLKLLQELPNGYRMVFNLFAIEGFSHKEIAEILKITEGTSKSQFAKAKMALQKLVIEQSVSQTNKNA